MNARLLTAVLLVAALITAAPAAAWGGDDEVPAKEADAKTQFAAAALLEKQIRGTKGAVRRAAQQKAAVAYEAVHRHFPEEAPLATRALYRAAELYERLRDRENGVRCLKLVLALKSEDRTRARAHNLLGHIYRRAKNWADAVKEYETVVNDHAKARPQVATALGWLGKCKARLGDHAGAREAWNSRIQRFPERLGVVIESFDWIACDLHGEGKVKEARETLETCQAQLKDAAADSGPAGQRVRKALARMRIHRLLKPEKDPKAGR